MNIFEQTITIQELIHNPWTWWIGGGLVYFACGLITRRVIIRNIMVSYKQTWLDNEDKVVVFLSQVFLPITLVYVVGSGLIALQSNSLDKIAEKISKESKK